MKLPIKKTWLTAATLAMLSLSALLTACDSGTTQPTVTPITQNTPIPTLPTPMITTAPMVPNLPDAVGTQGAGPNTQAPDAVPTTGTSLTPVP